MSGNRAGTKTPFGSFYFFRGNYGYGVLRSNRVLVLWLGRVCLGWTTDGSVFHSATAIR